MTIKQNRLKPLKEIISEHINLGLALCGGNQSKAAKLLGIARGTLRKYTVKLRELNRHQRRI